MSEGGIDDLLVLLSILVTCKFKGISALDFLMSRERDIDKFTQSGKKKRRSVIEVHPRGFPSRYRVKKPATISQLRAAARSSGVGALYDKSMETVRKHFALKQTTVDKIVFLNSAQRRVFFLLPKESSSKDGLRYTVYTQRLAEHLGVTVGRAKEILPAYRSLNKARRGNGEFGGGYFRDECDVVKFGGELEKGSVSVSYDVDR